MRHTYSTLVTRGGCCRHNITTQNISLPEYNIYGLKWRFSWEFFQKLWVIKFACFRLLQVPWETSKVFDTSAWISYLNDPVAWDNSVFGFWFYAQALTANEIWTAYLFIWSTSEVLHLERQSRYLVWNYKYVNHVHVSQQLVFLCHHLNDVGSVARTI